MGFFKLVSGLALVISAAAQSSAAVQISAAAQSSTGRACPLNSFSIFDRCICPYGTDFQSTTTYAILGVSAADFNSYTSSFYNIAWQGVTNFTRNGPDNTVGSSRTFNAKLPVGALTFSEKLDSFQSLPDGSYVSRSSQFDTPVEYTIGKGSFSGYWISFSAEYVAKYETSLEWSIYACFTGYPLNFALLHENALRGLLAVMEKAGLVKGNTTNLYHVQRR